MTAQVALLNKSAVALASDSAVTISSYMGEKDGDKIYNSVNKLYTLSKYHPVGIMVNGNASFMGIPWETIIKVFRDDLKDKSYRYLEDYGNKFIEYLSKSKYIIDSKHEIDYFKTTVGSYYFFLSSKLDDHVKNEIEVKGEISKQDIQKEFNSLLLSETKKWEKHSNILNIKIIETERTFLTKFKEILKKIRKDIFKNFDMNLKQIRRLNKLSFMLFTKENFGDNSSEIIITGFGDKEIYPSLYSYIVEGRLLNFIKFRKHKIGIIDNKTTASIIPFAQDEMIHNFMMGVHPKYQENVIDPYVLEMLTKIPKSILDEIKFKNEKTKTFYMELFDKKSKDLFNNFEKSLERYRRKEFINPIMSILEFLPKDELAAMAESLINLTSFRSRVSLELETVGGPIDVAVLSKGDGFIWIKRKHYFQNELNQHFIRNYFQNLKGKYEKNR